MNNDGRILYRTELRMVCVFCKRCTILFCIIVHYSLFVYKYLKVFVPLCQCEKERTYLSSKGDMRIYV